ncbi:ribosomal-protein-alanine N-acetyltransferase [Evansella caseinilytica]|uniref:Ribosomal-protein-alanine N-acetyltransferase n=1 Tax=Evansella caseinilytica TaxID=1503961 RepID=A0A1H3I3J9_9BACI|nr:carbon-nitrogen hydrolase family protein [Evansella caseinilytica]SDY21678.1 ribosomal-protein-alanine N-acetyltransferase [Evansella caseinilytica]
MKIGLAQARFPTSAHEGLVIVKEMMKEAKRKKCRLLCFPESIIPGLRGVGFEVEEYDHRFQQQALKEACELAGQLKLAVILPMEWQEQGKLHLLAFVIRENGELLGRQTKNQIDPGEDFFGYVPGDGRSIFEVGNVKFGIAICHEGWRYPETVRWAARQGASIVFHPQFTGDVDNPEFFNYAMVCRSLENNLFFASVNYALENQRSTSALISPSGERLLVARPNTQELLVYDVAPAEAHLLLARRFHPDLF